MKHNVESNTQWYIEVLQKNSLSILLLLVSALITLLNAYSFIKLAPIIEGQRSIASNVNAIDTAFKEHIRTSTEYIKDIVTLKQSVVDIKERTARIEDKIDQILSK